MQTGRPFNHIFNNNKMQYIYICIKNFCIACIYVCLNMSEKKKKKKKKVHFEYIKRNVIKTRQGRREREL